MKKAFADTGYWIALFDARDNLHDIAKDVTREMHPLRVVTSEPVLTEFANAFAAKGEGLRRGACAFVREVLRNVNIETVPSSSRLFQQALELYEERPDKDWSLTDCSSIVIMGDKQIFEALAHDRCFEQAGYRSLLRRAAA